MGSVEINDEQFLICSHIITYGNSAEEWLTEMIRDEIETMWNEPVGRLYFNNKKLSIRFQITASFQPSIKDIDIYQNLDSRNNYFRIEEFAVGTISFVDGVGCNTGYFKLENLYKGSTTAAHEYGHTLGLHHPEDLDIRGKGIPGIMYPRGTLVDPQYQYDSTINAGEKGGTLHPAYRKVLQEDFENLKLHQLDFVNGKSVLGDFTSVWHPDHSAIDRNDHLA